MLRLRLCSVQADILADFYERALGFQRVTSHVVSNDTDDAAFAGCEQTLLITLQLREQQIELWQCMDHPGRPYPREISASDLVFQHFAIVVADMNIAMRQLSSVGGWSPITIDGPQRLPASSGSVTAFKFRDPEGHPLELLAFPLDATPMHWQCKHDGSPFLGIDHSAISVSDSTRSVAFYTALGLSISNHSTNEDPAQGRLDHLDKPIVDVTAMSVNTTTPHLELLDYRHTGKRRGLDLRINDIAATCMVFEAQSQLVDSTMGDASAKHLVDPDGHHLLIVAPT